MSDQSPGLRVLVVDDEQPALDELVYLLGRDERVGTVATARTGAEALRLLDTDDVDVLFLDIAMPGLSGIDLARVVGRFRRSPRVVFVTAHDDHAVEAFELGAVDYLLKPVREERLAESVRRAVQEGTDHDGSDETIAVELGGVTRFVQRSRVAYAEANGDYVRLHVVDGTSHLVRMPLGTVAEDWAPAGFVRVHRSVVVNRAHVREVRQADGRTSVVVPAGDGVVELAVARRHTRAVRELLIERAP